MERITHDGSTYARIEGVGLIKLAKPNERLTLNQAINAKSYQAGMLTRYHRLKNERLVFESMKCFISICNIRIQEIKEAPNRSQYFCPSCF